MFFVTAVLCALCSLMCLVPVCLSFLISFHGYADYFTPVVHLYFYLYPCVLIVFGWSLSFVNVCVLGSGLGQVLYR